MVAGSEFIGAALIQDPDSLTWFAGHGDPAAARAANEEYEIRAGGPRHRGKRSRSCANGGAAKCCASRGATWPGRRT